MCAFGRSSSTPSRYVRPLAVSRAARGEILDLEAGHVTAVKDRAIGREAPADGDMIGGHSRPQGNQEAVAQDNVVGVTFL